MVEPFAIGWCDPGEVSGRFAISLFQTQLAARGEDGSNLLPAAIRIGTGPRIARARNDIVRTFLSSPECDDVKWLLMVDSDMAWEPEAIAALFEGMYGEDGKILHPVIGGLCFAGGNGFIAPTMYRVVDPNTNDGDPITYVSDWVEGEVVPVDATGAAFLLIHRGILEALATLHAEPYPWFADGVHAGHEFGEDWGFCARVRQQGWPIHVATAAKISHFKSVALTEEMWRTGRHGLENKVSPPTPKDGPNGLIIPMAKNREQRRAEARAR